MTIDDAVSLGYTAMYVIVTLHVVSIFFLAFLAFATFFGGKK